MKKKFQLSLIYILLYCLICGLIPGAAMAQSASQPPPSPREALLEAVRLRARKDVEMDKAMENASGLHILFGEEAKSRGIGMNEVLDVYETAYQVAQKPKSPFDEVLPSNPINLLALIIAVVLGIMIGIFRESVTKLFKWVLKEIYNLVARFRPFWSIALTRYRKALARYYGTLKIPFRPERPLEMKEVYVPLHVAGNNREVVDAYESIHKHKCLAVTGAPGAGKSMLLKNLALTYSRQGLADFEDHPVPLLLELNRFNNSDVPLTEHLTTILEQHNFPGAGNFLNAFLRRKQLLLLFDGLDELTAGSREGVVRQIKDLLQKYPGNRFIITCRTAVYKNEFGDVTDRQLEISEFNDRQIQHFLSAWVPDMPQEKSIEHFLHSLRKRPLIMALARNPLLLTMIAYLYTDTEFILPHSRAEFYTRSTDLLLEKWKEQRNRYKAIHKRLVLQHLSFFVQKQTNRDRRSIDLVTALEETKKVLPHLTLKEEDAHPLLDEIVNRSGLLLRIDGGARFQFTHQTLQEFFAARETAADPEKLLGNFAQDSSAWREVIRLWCGLEHDCTALIRRLYKLKPLLAFECLGDAQKIDPECAEKIIEETKKRLPDAACDDNLARAFGLMAADPRERGIRFFSFLEAGLSDRKNRIAAAACIANTNLPGAAAVLAEYAIKDEVFRPFLINMGDLAVPALAEQLESDDSWIMEALTEIGTPRAALALVPLLWKEHETLPYQAAWNLGSLLRLPNVEAALRGCELSAGQRKAAQIEWIWSPFEEPGDSALQAIAGRIGYLIYQTPETMAPRNPVPVDRRLVIPLCTIMAQKGMLRQMEDKERKKLIKKLNQDAEHKQSEYTGNKPASESERKRFEAEFVENISNHVIWLSLFRCLPLGEQRKIVRLLIYNTPVAVKEDWLNIKKPSTYLFEKSFQAKGIKLLLILLGLLNTTSLVRGMVLRSSFLNWENIRSILGIIVIIVILVWLVRKKFVLKSSVLYGIFIFIVLIIGSVTTSMIGILTGNLLLTVIIGVVVGVVCLVVYVVVIGAGAGAGFAGSVVVGSVVVAGVVVGGVIGGFVGGFVGGVVGRVVGGVVGGGVGGGVVGGSVVGVIGGGVGGGVVGGFVGGGVGDGVGIVGSGVGDGVGSGGVGSVGVGSVGVGSVGVGVGVGIAGGCLLTAITSLSLYLPLKLIYQIWDWPGAALFLILYLGALMILFGLCAYKQRRAENPLYILMTG